MITGTATFSGGARPTSFSVRSRSILRPARAAEFCSICEGKTSRWESTRREVQHAGHKYIVCGNCRKQYHDSAGQIELTGMRFRFVEKAELETANLTGVTPSPVASIPNFRQIYKILLLLKERQEKLKKEVNWVPEELTKKFVKLPDRIAAIVSKTFVVRGDDFKVSDDEALIRIRDLLEAIDPKIIDRNKNRRLP